MREGYAEAIKAATIHHDTLRARGLLRSILERNPNYAPALHLASRLAESREEAVLLAEKAYAADSTNRYYLEALGSALLQAEEYEKALPLFEKIAHKSTEPDHYRILAILLNGANRKQEAIAILDTAQLRFGRIPHLGNIRQYLYLQLGRPLEAEADARKGVEEAPYIAENHLSLARVYEMTQRDSLALVSYQNAIAIDSLAVESWLALAEFYQKRNHHAAYLSVVERLFANEKLPLKQKIEEWRELTANRSAYRRYYPQYDAIIKRLFICYPSSREVTNLYAQHLISSGEIEEALRLYKQLVDYTKPQLDELLQIIEVESYLERPDSVKHYINLALHAFPKSATLLQMQALFVANEERYDEALTHLYEALKFTEDDKLRSSLWGSIGDIEHQKQSMTRCYRAYEKALRYNADNAMVLNNYAYFLSLEGRQLERALTMASRAISLSENNPTYLDTMAWVLYRLGRYTEAKKHMQQALSLDRSNSPELALHYGDILHALGEDFMAKSYWRKALERGYDVKEIERRITPDGEKK